MNFKMSSFIRLFTHVLHFPQTIDKEIEGKYNNFYISVF
jgi:hypothetical protein